MPSFYISSLFPVENRINRAKNKLNLITSTHSSICCNIHHVPASKDNNGIDVDGNVDVDVTVDDDGGVQSVF